MIFFSVLLALIAERFLHWSQLRSWKWFAQLQYFLSVKCSHWSRTLLLSVTVLPIAIIIFFVDQLLAGIAYSIPQILFNAVILIYCLGPVNFWVEIYSRHQPVTRAIFVAAHNQIFAVIFWFVLLGPAGAILYRMMSLCSGNSMFVATERATLFLSWLNWLPSRAFTFLLALVGDFSGTFAIWKSQAKGGLSSISQFIGDCGTAALHRAGVQHSGSDSVPESGALNLLDRVFILTLAILALVSFII